MHTDMLHANVRLPMLVTYCMVGQPQALMCCYSSIACDAACRLWPVMLYGRLKATQSSMVV